MGMLLRRYYEEEVIPTEGTKAEEVEETPSPTPIEVEEPKVSPKRSVKKK